MSVLELYKPFWDQLRDCGFSESGIQDLQNLTESKLFRPVSGDYPRWFEAYNNLPELNKVDIDVYAKPITCKADINRSVEESIKTSLQKLIPWRKGPFDMFSTLVDSEWQSWMKWERIEKSLPELSNKLILDVGSGNGYYMFKMLAHNPRLVMGIDPGLLQIIQFWSIEKYIRSGFAVLPVVMSDFPESINDFDVVFSMGVLYHRKSPVHHLKQIADSMKSGSHLVLETLVVSGDETRCLLPQGRYAQMRNVWFLPSVKMLEVMLARVGYKNIECVDVTITTTKEQRSTDWMKFHSLNSFLNESQTLTIEGYELPTRATIIAQKV